MPNQGGRDSAGDAPKPAEFHDDQRSNDFTNDRVGVKEAVDVRE